MFVNKLTIKEFRGIKSCKNPIELSNFTVLIGRNNSGKSSILEALSLLPDPHISNYITGESRINYLLKLHPPTSMKRLLYLYAGTSILEYDVQGRKLRIEVSERKTNTFIDNNRSNLAELISKMYQVPVQETPQIVLFVPYTTSILSDLENNMRNLRESITKQGYHISLAHFLNECVNDEYSEIVFLEPISLRKVYPDNKVYIQLRDLGSGAEKVVKIMALLEVLSPELVIIDDFETGLHPTLIRLFLKWLKEKKWQKIISTHSIDVLHHLIDVNPKDTTILQLNKSNEDILSHKILTLEQIEDFLDANNDPRLVVDLLGL